MGGLDYTITVSLAIPIGPLYVMGYSQTGVRIPPRLMIPASGLPGAHRGSWKSGARLRGAVQLVNTINAATIQGDSPQAVAWELQLQTYRVNTCAP